MKKNYTLWLDSFFKSWQSLEGTKTANLFAKDVKYYETPQGQPCDSFDEVRLLWAVVPTNQCDIEYAYSIVCETNDVCIVNWQMTRTIDNQMQFIDGVFQISLDDNDLCCYFKQWRYTVSK